MICPSCGTQNVPGAPTCARCATPLGQAASAEPAAPAAPDQPPAPDAGPPEQPPTDAAAPAAGAAPSAEAWAPPQQQPPAPSGEWAAPAQPGAPSGEWAAPAPAVHAYPPPTVAPYDQPSGPGYGPPSGPGYPGYGGPGYGPPPEKKRRRGLLVVALALVAVVALGVAAFVVLTKDEKDDEVVLEPITSVQEDDFTGNLDAEQLGASYAMASSQFPDFGSAAVATLASRTITGSEPGLYGGTQDAAVCNTDQMIAFLTDPANANKAEAWAGVQGIEVSAIPDYIGGLTAVRLRVDTRVTNHGFRDGHANGFQSLLQTGTAVLVDEHGVPRAKCNCGNPLLEPEETSSSGDPNLDIQQVAQNPEDAWDGFDPANVVTISPGDTVQSFTLVDSTDGSLFSRPPGSNGDADELLTDFGDLCDKFDESPTCGGNIELGTGQMQVTLQWTSSADLDLHVTEPDGTELYWQAPGPSNSGGQLDVDSNVGCVPTGSVENVYWSGAPPAGNFTVGVNGFDVGAAARTDAECGGGDYTLTIRIAGRPDEVHEGSVADEETDPYPVTF